VDDLQVGVGLDLEEPVVVLGWGQWPPQEQPPPQPPPWDT
jgi:hypothetical protein